MDSLRYAAVVLSCFATLGCSSSSGGGSSTPDSGVAADASADSGVDASIACSGPCPASKVKYLVVIVQENHTFDDHFGVYCKAAAGSSPTCNDGPMCCEAAPATEPGGAMPTTLDDAANGRRDPDHTSACESTEMNGGAMDRYVTGAACSNAGNFAIASGPAIAPLWSLAAGGALADRWFQPIVGQSTANDMYFARAQFVFDDNKYGPGGAVGDACDLLFQKRSYTDKTLGDLLMTAGVPWAWYMEGYKRMQDAQAGGNCPAAPPECPGMVSEYPCNFDPSDNPYEYFDSTRDKPDHLKDLSALSDDLAAGSLPAVTFVKGLGFKTEHPGDGTKISDGTAFISSVVSKIQASKYGNDVLVIVTYDEGGGFFDHVKPPAANTADMKPYGTRVPAIAIGPFAKKNFVSHVVMEHTSVVKFIEWNWLATQTGQLMGRDANVANLGSLLDPAATGVKVPE